MEISVIGAGYVGLVTGACLAHLGHRVTCLDIDAEKVARLRRGELPIYEPGLDSMVSEGMAQGRLSFTQDPTESIPQSECIFVAVQTPMASNGEADLIALLNATHSIAPLVRSGAILILKSTAPIGTASQVERIVAGRNGSSAHVVANPEFLREGTAVQDFLNPDRVIVGARNPEAAARVAALYRFADCPVIITDPNTAEMIKYASNAFLAAKISFMNEIAQICDELTIDVRQVAEGMGHDPRIGPDFLRAGLGWGGSCLPKDVQALIHMAKAAQVTPRMLEAVRQVNANQRRQAVKKLEHLLGDLNGTVIGLLGLAFKPGTDDLRSAPSLDLVEALTERGAHPRAYDPVAMERARALSPGLTFCEDPYQLADGADALVLVTEWPSFRDLDMAAIRQRMARPVLLDGRNFWDGAAMADMGFVYAGFGVSSSVGDAASPASAVAATGGLS